MPGIIVVLVIAVLVTLMIVGWRRRGRSIDVPAPQRLAGEPAGVAFDGLYLATTLAADRLQRVTAHGLGYRQRGRVVVAPEGIVLLDDVFIPTTDVASVGRATWTIDRGVEPNGLNTVSWRLGDQQLTSYFRLDDPQGFDAATTQYTKEQDRT